jgi:hypothetical protein
MVSNLLALPIIANQINDSGIYYKSFALRNAYNIFLISKRTIAINTFDKFINLKNPLNCFLASCYIVFNQPKSITYNSTVKIAAYLSTFKEQLNDDRLSNKRHKKTERKLFIKSRLDIIYKSFFDTETRQWLIKRITDKSWHREKLIQLGFKKSKKDA